MNLLELQKKTGLSNREFWGGIAAAIKKGWIKREGMAVDVLIRDPPQGADEKLVQALREASKETSP